MTPERILLDGLGTPEQRFHALRHVMTPEHTRMLNAMPYEGMLQTPYWRIVARYVKRTRGKCNRCARQSNLQVHHRTYEHRGCEVNHLDDLEVLCRSCHAHAHGLIVASGEWRSVRELMPEAMKNLRMLMEVA